MSNGDDVYQDDPTIAVGDPIWRRIPPGAWTYDHNLGRVRPTSQNFQYSRDTETGKPDPMSIVLGLGLNPDVAVAGHPGFKLVGWTAGYVRGLELGVCRDDQPEIVAHGLVFTLQQDAQGNRKNKISNSVRDRLADSAQWTIGLTVREIEEARRRTQA